MMNEIFKHNGAIYALTESGYCYKTENGKKTRIKRSEYDEASNEYTNGAIRARLEETLNRIEEPKLDEATIEEALENAEKATEDDEVREAAQEAQGQEKAKRKPRKRIPKSVGYRKEIDGVEVILTEKQLDFLNHLPDTCFWEDGTNSEIWVDCLCDEIGGQFKGKPMTVGAMISTLCEKGLGYRAKGRVNNKKCTSFGLTELGKQVAQDLGL